MNKKGAHVSKSGHRGFLSQLAVLLPVLLSACASEKLLPIDPNSPDALQNIVINKYLMSRNSDPDSRFAVLPENPLVPYIVRLDLSNEALLDRFEVTATWIGDYDICAIWFPWTRGDMMLPDVEIIGRPLPSPNSSIRLWRGTDFIKLSAHEQMILMSFLKLERATLEEDDSVWHCPSLPVACANRSQRLTLQAGRIVERPFPIVSLSFYPGLPAKYFDSEAYTFEKEMPERLQNALKEARPKFFHREKESVPSTESNSD